LRNIFDQYDQAENKLTHALILTLYHERRLIVPFLKWLGIKNIPSLRNIELSLQQLPGEANRAIPLGEDSVPDACFCDNDNWAVIIESKVQASISIDQLKRHCKKTINFGYNDIFLVLITVNTATKRLPGGTINVEWKSIYRWFVSISQKYEWARYFVEYMQVYESKMVAQDYNIEGTLTMFSGFCFNKDSPYTYREGKRLIKLLGQEFRKNTRLVTGIGIDPESEGRPAITQGEYGSVWDFIQLKNSQGNVFTSHPHAAIVIRPEEAAVSITVPNGIKGGIKKRFNKYDFQQFDALLAKIEHNLKSVIGRVPGAKPTIGVAQRHYKSRRSYPEIDGKIEVDLRTIANRKGTGLKHQPTWSKAIFDLLIHKRTNMQLHIAVIFPFSAKYMQNSKAIDIMVDAWIAMKPLLDFLR